MLIYRPDIDPPAPVELIGGKAYNLARSLAAGVDVPRWFAVTTTAFEASLVGCDLTDPILLEQHLDATGLPAELLNEIDLAVRGLGLHDRLLAVRSSAVGEDSAGLSYAGQLESWLFVRADEIAAHVKKVWRSACSARLMAYQQSAGLEPRPLMAGVIVQEMIDADVSGVAFGADPVSGRRDAVVIAAVYGLGEGLVQGDLDADRYVLIGDRIESTIVSKTHAVRFDREAGRGTRTFEVPTDRQGAAALAEPDVQAIAAAVRALGELFGAPQDVEWGIAGGQLYILQSRPITTLGAIPDHSGTKVLWDNSNIIESYSGVTTPLTFSFIKDVYTEVYREFCRILGVAEQDIERNRHIFQMLGLIQGRVYYNLLNWYKVLALLPGYSINAAFMEQMMGVREKLDTPPTVAPSESNPYVRLGISLYRLVQNLVSLERNIAAFQAHLDETLHPFEEGIGDIDPETAMNAYHHLEEALLKRWRIPILNDFYTMIFYGLLKKLVEGLGLGEAGAVHNGLLAGEGGIISTEPLRALRRIANAANEHPELRRAFETEEDESLLRRVMEHDAIGPMLRAYIRRFGDRYPGELKLETITPSVEPVLLMRQLRPYVLQGIVDTGAESAHEGAVRRDAERHVMAALRGSPFKVPLFRFVLRHARARVRDRENLRFERTRVFAVVRGLFVAIGRRFHALGMLDDPRDIFYLTRDEIFSFIIGTSVSTSLRETVAVRREEFRRYALDSPDDRFATFGVVYRGNTFRGVSDVTEDDGTGLTGVACSPGVVRAPVRRILNPAEAEGLEGCILVAERTDPGWAPLFPLVRGLLIERGSLLSHSAIVAREMGIPAIVGIRGLMNAIEDGEMVEMDGASGVVRRLSKE